MIVFDLRCGDGHVFEAWFASSADFEDQSARGLTECPLCGDARVGKAAMAPAVPAKGNRAAARALSAARAGDAVAADATAGNAVAGNAVAGDADTGVAERGEPQRMLAALARFQAEVEARCEDVGNRFAETARAVHFGETPARGIYGSASRAEVAALGDDGIAVARLPFRPRARYDA